MERERATECERERQRARESDRERERTRAHREERLQPTQNTTEKENTRVCFLRTLTVELFPLCLTWIRLHVVHLVKIFRDEKLLQEMGQRNKTEQTLLFLAVRTETDVPVFKTSDGLQFVLAHHNSSVVLAYEDAPAVMVVGHGGAWS